MFRGGAQFGNPQNMFWAEGVRSRAACKRAQQQRLGNGSLGESFCEYHGDWLCRSSCPWSFYYRASSMHMPRALSTFHD